MNGFAIFVLFLLGLAVAAIAVVFGTNIVVWNLNDIADKGANFWNVFWIILVALVLFGGTNKVTS